MRVSKPAVIIAQVLMSVFLSVQSSRAQKDSFKIYLVGDAGDHTEAGETLLNLHKELISHPNSAVIFLGDNSYKDILWGIIPFGFKGFDSSLNTMEKIRSQLNLVDQYKGYIYFTPGNHDWWNRTSYAKGVSKLAMEESFIKQNLKGNPTIANPEKSFLPSAGHYGPEWVELNNRTIRLVFLDTYRIIQTGFKKGTMPEEVSAIFLKLDSVVKEAYLLDEKVVVIGHHPVFSKSPHNRTLKRPYLFGRIKSSNASFPSYLEMAKRINEVLHRYPGIYYVSGHIHALQYFYTSDSIHYIISGAGSKENKMSKKEIARYDATLKQHEYLLWNTGGFFELGYGKDSVSTILFYNGGSQKCSLP